MGDERDRRESEDPVRRFQRALIDTLADIGLDEQARAFRTKVRSPGEPRPCPTCGLETLSSPEARRALGHPPGLEDLLERLERAGILLARRSSKKASPRRRKTTP